MAIAVTARQIAKILVRPLPVDGHNQCKVEEYTKTIEAMPQNHKLALQSAYIFSSKLPTGEQADFFQHSALAVLQNGTESEKLAYTIAQHDFRDWIEKRETQKRRLAGSLNETRIDQHGNEYELIDTIGVDSFENKVIARVEAQRLYRELPHDKKLIVKKLFRGEPLLKKERDKIYEYRETHLRHKNKAVEPMPASISQIIEKQGRLTSTERSTLFRYRRKNGQLTF